MRRCSGKDVVADAVEGPSLAEAMECFGDVIPLQVMLPRTRETDGVGRPDKPRCGYGTDMGRGGGKARIMASATSV